MINQLIGDMHRPILIHFFDNSCQFSRANMKHLVSVSNQLSGNVIAVVKGIKRIEINRLREETGFIILEDNSGEIFKDFNITSTPVATVWNEEKNLVFSGNYTNGITMCGAADIMYSNPILALKAQQKKSLIPYLVKAPGYACEI
ncbi:DUF6436 domain-containing protein [Reichenbachiella versicolor]|uniref:DUF6436 domain-containing protein n=1 Tax=Reichenbachiella versicolor TaxID=1821036 RepID=UPI0013A54DDD|nr:hypothetical protein [Reichenbachiella versicolor]